MFSAEKTGHDMNVIEGEGGRRGRRGREKEKEGGKGERKEGEGSYTCK